MSARTWANEAKHGRDLPVANAEPGRIQAKELIEFIWQRAHNRIVRATVVLNTPGYNQLESPNDGTERHLQARLVVSQ
ncbi:hypothetical protein Tamer19_38390 [Cupriavidus sp. TA19]|nr:hypothetical protein Tamer19_38390 [Cupriavidus sp. TA19]